MSQHPPKPSHCTNLVSPSSWANERPHAPLNIGSSGVTQGSFSSHEYLAPGPVEQIPAIQSLLGAGQMLKLKSKPPESNIAVQHWFGLNHFGTVISTVVWQMDLWEEPTVSSFNTNAMNAIRYRVRQRPMIPRHPPVPPPLEVNFGMSGHWFIKYKELCPWNAYNCIRLYRYTCISNFQADP